MLHFFRAKSVIYILIIVALTVTACIDRSLVILAVPSSSPLMVIALLASIISLVVVLITNLLYLKAKWDEIRLWLTAFVLAVAAYIAVASLFRETEIGTAWLMVALEFILFQVFTAGLEIVCLKKLTSLARFRPNLQGMRIRTMGEEVSSLSLTFTGWMVVSYASQFRLWPLWSLVGLSILAIALLFFSQTR